MTWILKQKSNILFLITQAMKKIEHNAPGFHYKVYWKNENEERWNMKEIFNWETNQLVIEDQPTYQEYKIKVVN